LFRATGDEAETGTDAEIPPLRELTDEDRGKYDKSLVARKYKTPRMREQPRRAQLKRIGPIALLQILGTRFVWNKEKQDFPAWSTWIYQQVQGRPKLWRPAMALYHQAMEKQEQEQNP